MRYSCPLAFPTRLLLLLALLLAPFVARYSFVAKYEHARYPYVANHEHPPGTGTTRGATPGYPCVARAPTRPCARTRVCPYAEHAVRKPLTKVGRVVRVAVAQRLLENDAKSARSAEAKKRESDLPDLPRRERKLIEHILPVASNDVNT